MIFFIHLSDRNDNISRVFIAYHKERERERERKKKKKKEKKKKKTGVFIRKIIFRFFSFFPEWNSIELSNFIFMLIIFIK